MHYFICRLYLALNEVIVLEKMRKSPWQSINYSTSSQISWSATVNSFADESSAAISCDVSLRWLSNVLISDVRFLTWIFALFILHYFVLQLKLNNQEAAWKFLLILLKKVLDMYMLKQMKRAIDRNVWWITKAICYY